MKTPDYGFFFYVTKHIIMFFSLLSFAITAHAVETAELPLPVGGRLVVTGSVALSNLMTYWTQEFSERNPLITVTIADPGGNAGIEALINGTAEIALTSAPINRKQEDAFEARFGYTPQVIPVAMDAVAVYVNDSNPLTRIALQDLDAIFSSTYRCGESQPIQTWGTLGVKGNLAKQRITVYGLTVATGATSLFREIALCGGDFIKDFQTLAGPEAVESALGSDFASIGFSSSAMRSAGIHALAIASHKGALAVAPTTDTIRSGQYPMSRTLSIAINRPKNQPLSPALQSFIDFVLSPEGQSVVTKAGYVSLP
ncbi:PstS family phosphate ABC transporter substrate-binding protein [Methylobacter tundripaludum]|uniref:PstS family phosphate ABC transporter substrate-binding protein n=1 Tax=Methylobacter tundripaludum TaxID=173365 RepID=UPI001377A695|nr:substrate-binding domain-containing protein [Methylobacter tundripaludum]